MRGGVDIGGQLGRKGTLVRLNCGGIIQQVDSGSLARWPDSYLARACCSEEELGIKLSEAEKPQLRYDQDDLIFLDRHPGIFIEILNFYRTGIAFKPLHVHNALWEAELEWFGLQSEVLDAAKGITSAATDDVMAAAMRNDPMMPPKPGFRQSMWLFLEDPASSCFAKLFSLVSLTTILVSVTGSCLETLYDSEFIPGVGYVSVMPPIIFAQVETACIIFFTIEFFARLAVTNHVWKFMIDPMNMIDVLAILPFYIQLMADDANSSLSVIRIFRLVRVFKLGRHSQGLTILGRTITSSMNELLLLLFFLSMGVLLFATAIYFAEHGREGEGLDGKPVFRSIPHSFYWAVVTMTTLGYGDLYPSTSAGMFISSICAICGVVMIALPMVVIGQNFADHYQKDKELQALRKKFEGEQGHSSLITRVFSRVHERASVMFGKKRGALLPRAELVAAEGDRGPGSSEPSSAEPSGPQRLVQVKGGSGGAPAVT